MGTTTFFIKSLHKTLGVSPWSFTNELRLMTSANFDSRLLMSVILSGDHRLIDKLRRDELIPLGSRMRIRYTAEYVSVEQLTQTLIHLITTAGNPHLMTKELIHTLSEHALGNYRALCTMADTLLMAAAQQEKTQLDEKLYLKCFAAPSVKAAKK